MPCGKGAPQGHCESLSSESDECGQATILVMVLGAAAQPSRSPSRFPARCNPKPAAYEVVGGVGAVPLRNVLRESSKEPDAGGGPCFCVEMVLLPFRRTSSFSKL